MTSSSTPNFFQGVRDVRGFRPLGFIGEWARSHDFRSLTAINASPQAKQVSTTAINATPTNISAYTVTVQGVDCTYTTDASATQAELGAGLEAAINGTAGARGVAVASYAGGTLTLTGVWPGVGFTIAVSGGGANPNGAPATPTAAAEAAAVEFGRVLIRTGQVTDEGNQECAMADAALFTAQVLSLTFVTAAGAFFGGDVKVNGQTYQWGPVPHNTDLDTTAGDIETAINAALPANTVIAASVGGGGGVVTLTAEVAGAEFDASSWASGAAAAVATKANTTGPSISTSLLRSMLGVSVRRMDVEATSLGGPGSYEGNMGVEVATRGRGVLQRDTAESWAYNDELFVSVASATAGRVYNAAGADRVWIGSDLLTVERSESSTTTDGLGVVRLDMGA